MPRNVGQDRCARLSPPRQFDRSNLAAAWRRNSFRSMQCMNGTSNIDATSPSASRSRSIERAPNCRNGRENGAAILLEGEKDSLVNVPVGAEIDQGQSAAWTNAETDNLYTK